MGRDELDTLVVGAGVSGLTTAVCLAEAGLRVAIWAAERPERTTSYAAGAMWWPYLVEPSARVRDWSIQTLDVLRQLAADPTTGVRLVAGVEASRLPAEPPEWANQLTGFRLCEASELPAGFASGWRYSAPLVDMPTYLGYLERQRRWSRGILRCRSRRLRGRDRPGAAVRRPADRRDRDGARRGGVP
jgi:D-amino-acid oxidase